MPSTPGSGLKVLIEEARHRHEDTRPDMLRALVGLYVREPQHSEAEQGRFATLARRLIDAVEVPVAAKMVREIAPRADLPRDLVLHLATAPLALAGPVLRLSPVLTDEDLVAVASTASSDHFAAVSARRDVSPALAKQLAQLIDRRGGDAGEPVSEETPQAVEAAPEPAAPEAIEAPSVAPVSVDVALTAVIALADEAKPETPPTVAETPAVSDAPIAPETTDSPPEPTEAPSAAQMQPEKPAPPAIPNYFTASPEERTAIVARLVTLPPLPLGERPAAATEAVTDALLEAARSGEPAGLAAVLESALGVTPENAAHIVADGSGQAFAVAARALGLSFAVLSRVLFRLHPATGRLAAEMTRLAETFDMLPVASAQHLVASWRAGRRLPRERGEDTPSMRSYGAPRSAPQGTAGTADAQQHG